MQDTVTVYAFESGHKISTYRLLALSFIQMHLHQRNRDASRGGPVEQDHWWNKAEPAKQISNISRKSLCVGCECLSLLPVILRLTKCLCMHISFCLTVQDELITGQVGMMKSESRKLTSREAEKLRKAAEKAEKARVRIEKRKKEWNEL